MVRRVKFSAKFQREFSQFPVDVIEDILSLVTRFLDGERLPPMCFKTFGITKNLKIQEFKVKDGKGNWRAISCFEGDDFITFIYAFHKKSQKLLDKDRRTIIVRMKEVLDDEKNKNY